VTEREYPKPSLTADVVAFSLDENERLSVLLILRGHDPFAGRWAIPGGFSEPQETVEQSAARELVEETGITGLSLEELGVFSRPGRDPRGWVVSVAHIAILPAARRKEAHGSDDATEAKFFVITEENGVLNLHNEGKAAGPLAFDHDEILQRAIKRFKERASFFIPELFGRAMSAPEIQESLERLLSPTR